MGRWVETPIGKFQLDFFDFFLSLPLSCHEILPKFNEMHGLSCQWPPQSPWPACLASHGGKKKNYDVITLGADRHSATGPHRRLWILAMRIGEFTMVSQPIRLILVDWFVFHFF